jgi:hypothetical protein
VRIYAKEKKGLGTNWSRTLTNVRSRRGVILAVGIRVPFVGGKGAG